MARPQFTKNITPKYINQPKPGKILWSMKDTEGAGYSVEPPDAIKLQPGVPVQVECEDSSFAGRDGQMVPWSKILTVQAAGPVQAGQAYSPPQQQTSPTQPTAPVAPQRAHSEQIIPNHVSNWVGQAIAAQTIQTPGAIRAWAAASYLAVGLVPPELPAAPDVGDGPPLGGGDLNDDLPFAPCVD